MLKTLKIDQEITELASAATNSYSSIEEKNDHEMKH
jgi:hypothetical protein